MTNTFFIGDTHFGHGSILKFETEARPFASLDDMHGFMISAWNSVVRKGDKVIHLGDFCWGEKYLPIAGELNGLKYLVLGNHDALASAKYLKYFHKVMGVMQFDDCVLTHIPVHDSQKYRYKRNIHGHLHSKNLADPWYINVSCEQNNLMPISYEDLKIKHGI